MPLSKKVAKAPTIWLGQSADTSSICASHPELRAGHFLTSLGCAIRRPSLRKTHFHFNVKAKLGITGPLMIDSGGFALLMNPNPNWTAKRVSQLITNIRADIFVSLDLPPLQSDSASERRKKIFKSYRNYCFLSRSFPDKIIMPVVHGRTESEIGLSLELLSRSRVDPTWVGLGGIVPLLQHRYITAEIAEVGPEVFIARALTMIRAAYPDAKIHAFGAGGLVPSRQSWLSGPTQRTPSAGGKLLASDRSSYRLRASAWWYGMLRNVRQGKCSMIMI
jgi:hypothetical protein